ncbi:protein DpdE [Streptomyces sp. NPDC048279]|uniref:protein DpdE n=1 Tax=Streptomyces sp. NPDC048279 TaxID=3154714 RepID=UPI00343044A1
MPSGFAVGHLVEFKGAPGIGRVGAANGDTLRIDFFESVAEPEVESRTVPATACRHAVLQRETRVFWRNPNTGAWLAGRVQMAQRPMYFVHFPNTEADLPVPEAELRVRWDKPVRDPLQVLVSGGNESGYFHNTRLPLLHNLVGQRAASASTPALLSSAVEIYPHQIHAALTVLSDPVQRYLLADEVGLGKTIQAGYVIRQTLIDNPRARVTVLTPEILRRQWRSEMCEKFFIDDFVDARVRFTSHETPEKWAQYHDSELVVVDEAHDLVHDVDNDDPRYRELCALAHTAPKLLLLSATPVTAGPTAHLALLHLLDPALYGWENRDAFERRHALREILADRVSGLDDKLPPLLPSTIDRIRDVIPEDPLFEALAPQVLDLLDEYDELADDADAPELALRVEALRAHISETYRLDRRVIRHRRARILRDDEESDLLPYVVRGRARPQVLGEGSLHSLASETLRTWQRHTWDHLLDESLDDRQTEYGLLLGVLTSRLGGPSTDFLDAMRWRVRRDTQAATRAGLTDQERELLVTPPQFAYEVALVERLEAMLDQGGLKDETDELVHALLPLISKAARTVIFAGPGSLASELTAELSRRLPGTSIAEHTRRAGSEASNQAVDAWRAPRRKDIRATRSTENPPRILVVDDSADDGLNLQSADTAVHLRLPWSPNRLEQRLGRIDRYPDFEATGHGPADQFVLAETEEFNGAWLTLLQDGYQVFTESVSTLQDPIAGNLSTVWSKALVQGPGGLANSAEEVLAQLGAARAAIAKFDRLESVHESSTYETDIAADLGKFEQPWRKTQDALLMYAGDESSGIKLRHWTRIERGCERHKFNLASQPLVSPHLYQALKAKVPAEAAEAAFIRAAALRAPGTRLYRIGNPLVDMLASVIYTDDRGQATAFWRLDPLHRGELEPYFGFDLVVEADVTNALALVANEQKARAALQRQADRILPPFTLKVWVPAGSTKAVTDEQTLRWLEKPYDNSKDHNYNSKLIRELVDLFGGWNYYETAARSANGVALDELERVTDLAAHCARAQQSARRRLAVAKAQAQSRQAAGHLLGDTESYLLDVSVADALVEGLTRPNVRLVAATCIVKSGYRRVRHDS